MRGKLPAAQPIIKFRSLVLGIVLLVILISGPLLAVRKQVYINNSSINLNKLNDSLAVLNKEIARLQFVCERYSSTERIETLAREHLGLDYPVSSQIVIVPVSGHKNGTNELSFTRDILATFRRSLGKDRG